jgi:hypothetical protein
MSISPHDPTAFDLLLGMANAKIFQDIHVGVGYQPRSLLVPGYDRLVTWAHVGTAPLVGKPRPYGSGCSTAFGFP